MLFASHEIGYMLQPYRNTFYIRQMDLLEPNRRSVYLLELSGNNPLQFLWVIRIMLQYKKDQIVSLAASGFGKANILESTCKGKTEVHLKGLPVNCVYVWRIFMIVEVNSQIMITFIYIYMYYIFILSVVTYGHIK